MREFAFGHKKPRFTSGVKLDFGNSPCRRRSPRVKPPPNFGFLCLLGFFVRLTKREPAAARPTALAVTSREVLPLGF